MRIHCCCPGASRPHDLRMYVCVCADVNMQVSGPRPLSRGGSAGLCAVEPDVCLFLPGGWPPGALPSTTHALDRMSGERRATQQGVRRGWRATGTPRGHAGGPQGMDGLPGQCSHAPITSAAPLPCKVPWACGSLRQGHSSALSSRCAQATLPPPSAAGLSLQASPYAQLHSRRCFSRWQ